MQEKDLEGGAVSGVRVENLPLQGVTVPFGASTVHSLGGERESRWKLGQEDYPRLVELTR